VSFVFLDIDGVLNHSGNYAAYKAAQIADGHDPDKGGLWWDHRKHVHLLFDPRCVAALNEITTEALASIVISSSWRQWYDGCEGRDPLAELIGLLVSAGVSAPILGVTPPSEPRRSHAIVAWLGANASTPTKLAILDDEDPPSFGILRPWCVRTNSAFGLIDRNVLRARHILRYGKTWHPRTGL
jgi:hypothetical protein